MDWVPIGYGETKIITQLDKSLSEWYLNERENTNLSDWIDISSLVNSNCPIKYYWECCWILLNANMHHEGMWANNWEKQCGIVTVLEKQKSWTTHNKVIRMRLSKQLNLSKRTVHRYTRGNWTEWNKATAFFDVCLSFLDKPTQGKCCSVCVTFSTLDKCCKGKSLNF